MRKRWKKLWKGFVLFTVVLVVLAGGAGVLFGEELKIASSIRRLSGADRVYYMEADTDYHFEEFLEAGGAASDKEVSAFLTKCISKGFYQMEVTNEGPACSVISALDGAGSHVWGRNFDWDGSVPIIVKCTPKDGYASVSTCDFKNITDSAEIVPEQFAYKMLAIAALYVPMDGMNEAGLCVADLEVNEGGMIAVDTDKPDLTVTTAIRLLLNRAATVEEAVALLGQYDLHASGGISHHLAISDASGASVSVEFVDGEMVVVDTNCVTNFNLDDTLCYDQTILDNPQASDGDFTPTSDFSGVLSWLSGAEALYFGYGSWWNTVSDIANIELSRVSFRLADGTVLMDQLQADKDLVESLGGSVAAVAVDAQTELKLSDVDVKIFDINSVSYQGSSVLPLMTAAVVIVVLGALATIVLVCRQRTYE